MVHKKLMQARMFLQQMALKKSGHNKFSNYYYFELGDFLPQINEIFHGQGLCGVISYDTDYASLTITDVDDGTNIVITSPMVEANLKGAHAIQNLGAVESGVIAQGFVGTALKAGSTTTYTPIKVSYIITGTNIINDM